MTTMLIKFKSIFSKFLILNQISNIIIVFIVLLGANLEHNSPESKSIQKLCSEDEMQRDLGEQSFCVFNIHDVLSTKFSIYMQQISSELEFSNSSTSWYIDIAMIYVLVSYVSTAAFLKFINRSA